MLLCIDEGADMALLSFFLSLMWWGIASLSFVYAKGYGGLLALRYIFDISCVIHYALRVE